MYDAGRRVWVGTKGGEREAGKKDLIEILKQLEAELGEKVFFGGESVGLVDVALIPFSSWFHTYETCGGFSIEDHCPKLISWVKRCMEIESVSKSLEDPNKVCEFALALKKKLGVE